jgi:hypothetical protein
MQNTNPAPHEQIFSTVLGFWQARALAVAAELSVPDHLAEGPLHVDELSDIRAIYEYLSATPCIEGPPYPSVLHNDCQ